MAKLKMGLGQINNGEIVFRKKHRWYFQGYNERGSELFKSFVYLKKRPTIDVKDDETEINFLNNKTWIPGKDCSKHISFYLHDLHEDVGVEYSIPRLDYGTLFLYDGCACELERWEFDCIEAKIANKSYDHEGYVSYCVHVEYESVMFHRSEVDSKP